MELGRDRNDEIRTGRRVHPLLLQLDPSNRAPCELLPKSWSALKRSPLHECLPRKRKEKVLGESSELRKPLRIKITTKRQEDPIIHVPTYKEIRKEHLIEAMDVSTAVEVSAKEAKNRENVVMVEKQILVEDVENLVEGDRDDEVNFIDDEEDDNDQHNVESLIKKKQKGSQEIRAEEKQIPIPTPPRCYPLGLTYF
uniref:Uncharacterized protein n=1 Tax=Tanacetum cinerariifolium TaxID=118510 RepID=A0A6L2KW17_TANCI|nr:hypothetical protein [Tanacetum cinerariifolium]